MRRLRKRRETTSKCAFAYLWCLFTPGGGCDASWNATDTNRYTGRKSEDTNENGGRGNASLRGASYAARNC
jgi:hypothetical protein